MVMHILNPYIVLGVAISGNKVTITPDSTLGSGMLYRVTTTDVGAVEDAANNKFGQLSGDDYQFTIVDTVPPTITTYAPTQGAVDVPSSTQVVITFSEPVQAGTGSFVFDPPHGIDSVTYSESVVTITPTIGGLTSEQLYKVTAAAGVVKERWLGLGLDLG